MEKFKPISGVAFQCESQNANLTVLGALDVIDHNSLSKPLEMTKRFYIDATGSLQKTSYAGATFFDATRVHVAGINSMGLLLHEIANAEKHNMAIIRGLNQRAYVGSIRKGNDNFSEHPDGTDWVMIDVDNIPVTEEISPYSVDAINWYIENRLPTEFRGVTCYYQFSSSAGICDAEGVLLKSGLCAHLFFFLDKRVPGKNLAAFLRSFCQKNGFYSIDNNKGGVALLTYGIDPAPIRSAVQLHYVSNPIVGAGVTCLLPEKGRDGFITGGSDVVQLPVIADNIIMVANQEHSRLVTAWKMANGYQKHTAQVRTITGIATTTYYKPAAGVTQTGRVMTGAKLSTCLKPDDRCILLLENENSPGSWYVNKTSATLARRWDGEAIPLNEFSESAYHYVRDELEWFFDNPHRTCQLTATNKLPDIDSFASARHSLILAPTGSGKTYQMTKWMAAKSCSTLVIYVAQTIPLVSQMAADLSANNTSFHHYQGFNYFQPPRKGIFLTTNESLPKILKVLELTQYVLVVDEFHRALDDFARNDQRLNIFKSAITQAQRVIYMTGTFTTVQRYMLIEIVSGQLGRRMAAGDYCCYEFPSVKRSPLHIRDIKNFYSDVIELFERYSELNNSGQSIPRTVLIMNTSKLEVFNLMFSHYNLTDQVEVVSRPENTADEIENARETTRPILIASPLFSIGLNFGIEPELLWCRFDRLDADTSQIIQTINRANRGEVACSVRIYAGEIDDAPFVFPSNQAVRDSLATMLEDESALVNTGYNMPMMLDRMAYNVYRQIERDTNKSLGLLIQDFAFQNYVVTELKDAPGHNKANHYKYGEFVKAAREAYDQKVIDYFNSMSSNLQIMTLLDNANELAKERKTNYKSESPRTERQIEDEELAIIMQICTLENPAQARKVKMTKLQVLLGGREPWLSDSNKSQNYKQSKSVAAGKLTDLVYLAETINKLATGEPDGSSLMVKLNQDKKLQKGFLALATSERDFFSMQKSFVRLGELKEAYRSSSRSDKSKQAADRFAKVLLIQLLEEIGIYFNVVGQGRNKHFDMGNPVLPAIWDFTLIVNRLKLLAELLESFPDDQPLEWGWTASNQVYGEILTCISCKTFYWGRCLRGNAVNFYAWGMEENLGIDSNWNECMTFSSRRNRTPKAPPVIFPHKI